MGLFKDFQENKTPQRWLCRLSSTGDNYSRQLWRCQRRFRDFLAIRRKQLSDATGLRIDRKTIRAISQLQGKVISSRLNWTPISLSAKAGIRNFHSSSPPSRWDEPLVSDW